MNGWFLSPSRCYWGILQLFFQLREFYFFFFRNNKDVIVCLLCEDLDQAKLQCMLWKSCKQQQEEYQIECDNTCLESFKPPIQCEEQ